ncbi:S1/P1 nuclease [Luteimonas yindakuii]|uniref:S1/P1 nuclease n=1 Tax=Luteimonas yindakuii TaxID=2565782 RepID=A0A4Z1R1G9_9GAMM|nr:S1/P1 nuclease [Luteimonas yindakuii]TKS53352.1 S1/P1 nuclease [Luteimonas yindakuii]
MTRTALAIATLAAGLVLASSPAHAWGPRGHRLVADIAEAGLQPQARAQVDALLEGETEPTLAGVANWADELRASDPDLGRRSASWHYVNIAEQGCDYDAGRDCRAGGCVVEAIRAQAAILADTTQPLEARRQALKFVVHFVGDVHQPMHAGYGHDRGGNDTQISQPDGTRDGRGTNLHSLWDSGLFRDMRESESAQLARLVGTAPVAAEAGDPASWAEGSCRVATTEGVYPPRPKIDGAYIATWRPVAERQIALGGARLAALLNDALSAGDAD